MEVIQMKEKDVALGQRIRSARDSARVSQTVAADAIGTSQPTYHRIELGQRTLRADELVILADLFGVRAAALTGLDEVRDRARYAARSDGSTDGSPSAMDQMCERLYAYLELDGYLTDQGIAGGPIGA